MVAWLVVWLWLDVFGLVVCLLGWLWAGCLHAGWLVKLGEWCLSFLLVLQSQSACVQALVGGVVVEELENFLTFLLLGVLLAQFARHRLEELGGPDLHDGTAYH